MVHVRFSSARTAVWARLTSAEVSRVSLPSARSSFSAAARRALGDRHGPRPVALAEERALLVHVLLIGREGGQGLAIARHLRRRREESVQAAEVRHRALRALLQEITVGAVAQDEIARLQPEEPRHHLLQGDFDLKGGQGAIGDFAMRPHEVIDGEEVPCRDAHQGHDDQGCRGEEFRSQPHSCPRDEMLWTPESALPRTEQALSQRSPRGKSTG